MKTPPNMSLQMTTVEEPYIITQCYLLCYVINQGRLRITHFFMPHPYIKVAFHPRGPRKQCVISAYIFNEKSRVRLGTK